MTDDQFFAQCRADVDKFEEHWKQGNLKNPENYPSVMEPGDWFEQFIAFLTTECDPGDGS